MKRTPTRYKLKCTPEDFMVTELPGWEVLPDGRFILLRMTKSGLDTSEALIRMGKWLGIRPSALGICGRKDRHALTSQYVSVPREAVDSDMTTHNGKELSIEPVGYLDHPLRPGEHTGNRFSIVVRHLDRTEAAIVGNRIASLSILPLPNYFDSQRFASARGSKRLAALLLAQGDAREAARIALAVVDRRSHARIKAVKRTFRDNWGDWDTILASLDDTQGGHFRAARHLAGSPDDLEGALAALGGVEGRYLASALQSFLFNQTLRRILKQRVGKKRLTEVPYLMGKLSFYKVLDTAGELFGSGPLSELATARYQLLPGADNEEWSMAFDVVMKGLGVTREGIEGLERIWPGCLNRGARELMFSPENIGMEEVAEDTNALRLEFDLPPGSYATLLVKYILGR